MGFNEGKASKNGNKLLRVNYYECCYALDGLLLTGTMSIFRTLASMVAGNTEKNGRRKLLLTLPLK